MHSDDNMHCTTLTTNTVKYQSLLAGQYTNPNTSTLATLCTCTRTKVNYAPVVVKPNQYSVGEKLTAMNSHLHPLDSFGTSCRSALKCIEYDTTGNIFGRDCLAANVVLGMNKLRYKDGNVDPRGFVAFLDRSNLTRSIIPRWKSSAYPFPQCRDSD